MGDEGSRPVSVACVAETPQKSVGPEFERCRWSFFACRLFLLSCDFHEYGYREWMMCDLKNGGKIIFLEVNMTVGGV